MRKAFQFRLGTLLWIVVVCAGSLAGFVHGGMSERQKERDTRAELQIRDKEEATLDAQMERAFDKVRRWLASQGWQKVSG